MTKGKKNSGPRTHAVDGPLSDRDISRYLHRVYRYAPYSITDLRELRKRVTRVLDRAMDGRERPRAVDIVQANPHRRYGYDTDGKRKSGSASADMTPRARAIYLSPCPVSHTLFDWGHAAKRSRKQATPSRVYLWSSTIYEPSPATVDRTSKASWMHSASGIAATFLQNHVLSMKARRGYSLPIDVLSSTLGRRKAPRDKRCIWPDENSIEATVVSSAPADRPKLRLDLSEELSTFFVDEPMFQLWDENVWVLVAPHRAVVLADVDLEDYVPSWA